MAWLKILNKQSKNITSAAIIIGGTSLASRVLGMFRDRILAGEFGTSNILDAYYAAFRIPDLVYNLLVLGALSAGLIPVFSAYLAMNKTAEGYRVINILLNLISVFLIIVCALLAIFAGQLVPLITPGFSGDKLALTIQFSRIMFLSPIFLGLSGIFGSITQSLKRFFIYSLAPIMYNFGIIIGALFFVKWWGPIGLAWGVVVGAALHFFIQLVGLHGSGYRYQWLWQWRHPGVKQISWLMIPRVLALSISQISLTVETIICSTLAAGSLVVFSFANNLQSFPLGVFAISFAVAALPTLSEFAAQAKISDFINSLSSTLRQIIFWLAPISVLLFVLRAQIVRVLLGTGQFDWEATRLTAALLAVFAVSLLAQGLVPLLTRAFYAWQDTKTPFYLGLIHAAINVSLALVLVKVLSQFNLFTFFIKSTLKLSDLADIRVLALPLAYGLAHLFYILALLYFLRKKIGRLDGRKIFDSTWRILFSSLGSGLVAFYTLRLVNQFVSLNSFSGVLTQGLTAGVLGVLTYIILGILLNSEEIKLFLAAWQKKLFRQVVVDKTGVGEGTTL
ncbi:MAG: murein biosynthesis integral membrane protein MurJ [Candidatus Buchananbacteria bacterium]